MARLVHGLILAALLAGCRAVAAPARATTEANVSFTLRSTAFANGAAIPRQYTCDGADQSPPLEWSELPDGTTSLALIVEDPDAPHGTFMHWVLYNLPPAPPELAAGVPHQAIIANGARQGRNDFRRVGYGGPCPPRGPAHHYHFSMYALNASPDLTPGATASELRAAMVGHTLGEAELIGTYGR
ncbi:MAG TPA: YbhB/YbcL family Raf kinase inhibitor-like protein [Chloroflexota bacterium]|nr:YbhB/YbcL family Raf kinase inhibitor-like protein [Chloroflexota bacterium]